MPVQAQRGGGSIAPTHWQSGTRRRRVVSTTFRPLYLHRRPGTPYTGGCLDLEAGMDGTENLVSTRILHRTHAKVKYTNLVTISVVFWVITRRRVVIIYTTPCNNPEDRRFHQHRHGSLKSSL
jgi:hypothetical protein